MGAPDAAACSIRRCPRAAAPGAPLALCDEHLLEAHDWVGREVGLVDVLPSPCLVCGSRLGARFPSGWLCAVCEWRHGDVPDRDVPVARVDVVYYLRFRDRIKIGTTANPRQRFAALRFDELLAFERGDRALEQRRHAQFAAHRAPGTEWFESHDALVDHVDELRAGVEDPWQLYARWVSEALAR